MKTILLTPLILVVACVPYQSFIAVTPRNDVPKGAVEIHLQAPMEDFLNALKSNGILYTVNESGAMTEEFLIDEGTRGKFTVADFDGTLRIIPLWGITDAVRQQQQIWAGMTTGSELTRVIYNTSETRPKQVFDYAVQIASTVGRVTYK
jgi:hypothetical protein